MRSTMGKRGWLWAWMLMAAASIAEAAGTAGAAGTAAPPATAGMEAATVPAPAAGGGAAQGETANRWAVAEVDFAGEVVFRVRGAQPEEAERRAAEAKARMWQAYQRYEAELAPELVSVRLVEGEPAVFLGDVWLVRVTEADRRANRSTGLGLARRWADNLRRVIAEYLRINEG